MTMLLLNSQTAHDTCEHDDTFLVYVLVENVRLQRASDTELLDLFGKEGDKGAIGTE
jgi:hypothetical protein